MDNAFGKDGSSKRWRRIRLAVIRRDGNCRMCGGLAQEVDHIRPRELGGGDEFERDGHGAVGLLLVW